jgi:hypothetical protein
VTAVGRRGRRDEHLSELTAIADDVVRREHRDDGLRVERRERRHGQADRSRIPARVRLDDKMVDRKVWQLLVDQRAVLGRGDDEDALARDELRNAVDSVLKKAPIAEQVKELLRSVAPREWPETRTGATGED